MLQWNLDLHGFDISAFDGSQLLSTGINIKSKYHEFKLLIDISVVEAFIVLGFCVWFLTLYIQYLTF